MLCFVFFGLCLSQRVVALDAGSSGTRAMLFEYSDPDDVYSFKQVNDTNGEAIYVALNTAFNFIKPDDAAQREQTMASIVEALFTKGIDKYVPEAERPNIPVLAYSTGGMRELDPQTRDKINQFVYTYLKSHIKYNVEQKNVRTLSGDEESLYEWITVNQLWKLLNSDKTMPIVSIGGATLEFTVELKEKPTDPFIGQYVYDVYINGNPHYTFRYAWLDYGTDVSANTMHQPLYDVGYMNTPCMYDGGAYSVQIRTSKDPAEWIDFIGIANYSRCYNLVADVMQKKPLPNTCQGHPGIFRDTRTSACIPNPVNFTDIHGLSTVMDAVSYVPSLKEDNKLKDIEAAAIKYAGKNVTEVMADNDGDDNSIWTLSNQAIVLSFLQRGFDSNPDINDVVLHTERKIYGNSVYIQLGSVIATYSNGFSITPPIVDESANENNKIVLGPGPIAGIAIACVVVVALIIGNIVFCCKVSHKDYEEPLNAANEDAETVET